MNRKSTLLAVVLMAVSSFTMNATEFGSTNDFFYLKSGDLYLSLDGNKSDSVIVKSFKENMTKAAVDSALWQIVEKKAVVGVTTYSIINKATLSYLAFAPAKKPVPNLVAVKDGVAYKWILDGTDNPQELKSFYSGDKYLSFVITNDKDLSLVDTPAADSNAKFTVVEPSSKFLLKADELGAGFKTFQLKFGDTYEGDIFSGKDLIAKDVDDEDGYVTLQEKGNEAFPDNKAKYFGVDMLKTDISGAKDVFGYNFSLDSTRQTQDPNADWQKFKFTVDLKNDSVSVFLKRSPESGEDTVQVVFASVGPKKVLTVSKVDDNGAVKQGKAPLINLSAGTHANIPTGSGVYFLQSASKGTKGKYYVKKNSFMGGDSVPSVNLPRGQWYIKTENGKYSVVDRESDDAFILNQEIFEVAEMEDTYLDRKSTRLNSSH